MTIQPQETKSVVSTVKAVDHDNAPAINLGDELTIRTSNRLELSTLAPGSWVIVRNRNINGGCYRVRQFWDVGSCKFLVAADPAIGGRQMQQDDIIDGVILEIRKSTARKAVSVH